MTDGNKVPKIIITSDDNPKYDFDFVSDKTIKVDEDHIEANPWTAPRIEDIDKK